MRVETTHDIKNYKSGNVLKNVGMTLEGIMRKAGENNFHTRYDVALYSSFRGNKRFIFDYRSSSGVILFFRFLKKMLTFG